MTQPGAAPPGEGGFTLVELAVAALVFGIISAAAVPVYIGYVHDARFLGAQQTASAVRRALEACVQSKGAGSTCTRSDVLARVGATPDGTTADGRWMIETATLALGTTPAAPMTGTIRLVGIAGKDTENLFVALSPPSAEIVTGFAVRTPGPPGGAVAGGGTTGGPASAGSGTAISVTKPAISGESATSTTTDGPTAATSRSKPGAPKRGTSKPAGTTR